MGMFSAPKGPSAEEIQAQQEAAAEAERSKLETEAAEEKKAAFAERQSRRAAFTEAVAEDEQAEDEGRRKFLKKA